MIIGILHRAVIKRQGKMSRVERVVVALKKEVSNIIHDELKDPRAGFITVTRIELTDDLRYAKIFFSVLGSEKEQKNSKQALESACGFIKCLIARRIKLRFVPEIRFIQDKSCEYSIRIQQELDKIKEHDNGLKKSNRRNQKK